MRPWFFSVSFITFVTHLTSDYRGLECHKDHKVSWFVTRTERKVPFPRTAWPYKQRNLLAVKLSSCPSLNFFNDI